MKYNERGILSLYSVRLDFSQLLKIELVSVGPQSNPSDGTNNNVPMSSENIVNLFVEIIF